MATPSEALRSRAKLLEKSLRNSPTAYARNIEATPDDLSLSSQLDSVNQQIEEIRSEELRNRWYGEDNEEDKGKSRKPKQGWLMGGLTAMQRPASAVIGAGQYALGKGTKSSLLANINEAQDKGLFAGDVLKQFNVPRFVQIPLGFALDVALDPVNWLTAGTAAVIPRTVKGLGVGLTKGGIKGAYRGGKLGLASSMGGKLAKTLDYVPLAKRSQKYTNLVTNLSKNAIAGAEKYDTLMGKTIYDKLGKGVFGQKSGLIGGAIETKVRSIPSFQVRGKIISGDDIVDFFKYSTHESSKISDMKDKVGKLSKNKGLVLVRDRGEAHFQQIDDALTPGAKAKIKLDTGKVVDSIVREADGSMNIDVFGKVKIFDSQENAARLLEIAGQDYNLKHLTAAYKKIIPGQTGVQWYDDVINKLKTTTIDDLLHKQLGSGDLTELVKKESDDFIKTWNSYDTYRDLKPLKEILDAYQNFIAIFKLAKVPLNVSSHVVATLGNTFMGAMMGLPIYKAEYLKSVAKSSKLVRGKLGIKGLRDIFFDDLNSWTDFLLEHPNRFREFAGITASDITNKLSAGDKIAGVLGGSRQQVQKFIVKMWDDLERGVRAGSKVESFEKLEKLARKAALTESELSGAERAILKEGMGKYKSATETMEELAKKGPILQAEMPGSWAASELYGNRVINGLKKRAADMLANDPDSVVARASNFIINSMPKCYEHIDQSFKIGTVDYLTRVGLTEKELNIISRTIAISADDLLVPITGVGEKLYRLKPLKASEVALEAYMNYAAIPDFVKIMRSIPIVGSPFLSFPYIMAAKTAKTAVSNPAVFNNIAFLMHEITGERTPEEKAALQNKYNAYLNSPTVVKLFGMWNTDVKNFVPYYTMNLFNPSDRTYGDSTRERMLKMMDKFPVFQDPFGGVFKDYLIQPWVLSGTGQTPQGQFGQPLYPAYDAMGKETKVGLGTKAFYGGRTLAEAVVPGIAGYAGALNVPLGLEPEMINLLPSYRARSMANAAQGRTSIGAKSKENAMVKFIRSLSGTTGIPLRTLDPTHTLSKQKEKQK